MLELQDTWKILAQKAVFMKNCLNAETSQGGQKNPKGAPCHLSVLLSCKIVEHSKGGAFGFGEHKEDTLLAEDCAQKARSQCHMAR